MQDAITNKNANKAGTINFFIKDLQWIDFWPSFFQKHRGSSPKMTVLHFNDVSQRHRVIPVQRHRNLCYNQLFKNLLYIILNKFQKTTF